MERPDVESILEECENAPEGPGSQTRKTMEKLCRHILHVEQESRQLSEERKEALIQLGGDENAPQMALVYLANKVFHGRRRALETSERRGMERDAALSKVKELEQEAKKYRLALEGLTPQGSEYYKDPERCVEYVRTVFESGHEAKKECVRLRRTIQSIRKNLTRDMNGNGSLFKCSACGYWWGGQRLEQHRDDCPLFNLENGQ